MSEVWPIEALRAWAGERCRLGEGRNARVRAEGGHHVHGLRLVKWMGRGELVMPLPGCGTTASFYDLSGIEYTDEPIDCQLCLDQVELGDLVPGVSPPPPATLFD